MKTKKEIKDELAKTITLKQSFEPGSNADYFSAGFISALEFVLKESNELRGKWSEDDIRRAFVAGAAWWEWEQTGATMWTDDRSKAEAEATKRYGECPGTTKTSRLF